MQCCFLLCWKDVSGSETADSGLLCWTYPVTGQLAAWVMECLKDLLCGPCYWVLGGREDLPSQLTESLEKTSRCFHGHFCFFGVENFKHTEIEHYNGPCVPFSQLQQWSIYSHLSSFRSQPLFPHPGLFWSKSLTSYYFTSKYFYTHLWKKRTLPFHPVILSYFKNFCNIIKYEISSQGWDLSVFFFLGLFVSGSKIRPRHCNW